MKKHYKELELKGKGYKKKLDDLQSSLTCHLEQYVDFWKSHLFLYDFEACSNGGFFFFFFVLAEFIKI